MFARLSICRNTLLLACSLFGALFSASAQSQPKAGEPPTATFKSETQLVLIPTIVTDKSGKAVEGLKQSDFTVLEDGRERKIAMVEEIHASSAPVGPQQSANGMYANHGGPQQARNIVIMVLDTINTRVKDQVYARQQMIKFLEKSLDRSALVSLMVLSQNGIKVIHDFTTDTNVLLTALRRLQSRRSAAEDIALDMDSADQAAVAREENELSSLEQAPEVSIARLRRRVAIQSTLESLRLIAQAYAGIPGRKSLVWASGGFPFGLDDFETAFSGTFDPQSETASDMAAQYRSTWRALNEANVALYPVDVLGLVSIGYDASTPNPRVVGNQSMAQAMQQSNVALQRQSMRNSQRIMTFQTFADRTGGRAFINTNDLAGSFRAAAADSTTYYMLGYYLDRGNAKPGWHDLKVKVSQKGTHIRSRSGFFLGEERTPEKIAGETIKAALNSPLEYTGMPLSVRWTGWAPLKGTDKARVQFLIYLPKGSFVIDGSDNNHCHLEMVAVVKKADGTAAGGVSDTLESRLKPDALTQIAQKGLGYQQSFDVPPGEYTVRFLVSDNLSGRIGTVEAPLNVVLTQTTANAPAAKDAPSSKVSHQN